MRAAGEAALRRHLESEIGTVRSVLVERDGAGRTEHFTPATIAGTPGAVVRARITGATARGLTAQALAA